MILCRLPGRSGTVSFDEELSISLSIKIEKRIKQWQRQCWDLKELTGVQR